MKLPRGVSGEQVICALEQLGYTIARQKGSHVRLKNDGPRPHSLTVPLHDPVKPGTLHGIITEVARAQDVTVEFIVHML